MKQLNNNIIKNNMKKNYVWAVIALALTLGACQNDETPEMKPEVKLNFKVDADLAPMTRAAANADMPSGTLVGVYFVETGKTDLTTLPDDNSKNHCYWSDGTVSDKDGPVYWNDYTSALDIYAYSPYAEQAPLNTAKTGIAWTVKTDQSADATAYDLLISRHLRGLTYTDNIKGGNNTLVFSHALAKLRINLIDNSAAGGSNVYSKEELAAATVSIKGLNTACEAIFVSKDNGKIDIDKLTDPKAITPRHLLTPADPNEASTPDAATPAGSTSAATHEAICIPQPVSVDAVLATITVKSNGISQNYSVKAPVADYALKQGFNNVINVTITKTEISLGFKVTDWGTTANSQTVKIDNLAGGTPSDNDNGDITPATGDQLNIAYLSDDSTPTAAASQQGTFTCTVDNSNINSPVYNWSATTPIYWDNFVFSKNAQYTFAALYTPASLPTHGIEKDYLTANATTTYGAPLQFINDGANDYRLKHIMSQLTIVLEAGTGYTATELEKATVTLLGGYNIIDKAPAPGVNFTTTTNGSADKVLDHNTTNGNSTSLHTVTLCPNTWAAGADIATVSIKDATAGTVTYIIRARDNSGNDQALALSPGENTTLTATINKTGIEVSFKVVGWKDVSAKGNGDFVDPAK